MMVGSLLEHDRLNITQPAIVGVTKITGYWVLENFVQKVLR